MKGDGEDLRALVGKLQARIDALESERQEHRTRLDSETLRRGELESLNLALADANARAAELMADLDEKNLELTASNRELARANAHAAELMAEIELKDERIEKLNSALALANARAANLMADLELSLEELERSNLELERFAMAASHDLMNPLRTVCGFLDVVRRKCPQEVVPDVKMYMGYAADEAERMMRMLDDLLEYARLNAGGLEVSTVDLDVLVEQAIRSLTGAIQEEQAMVTHDHLPTVRGYASALSRLLLNLLSNAIKFRSSEPPAIHVGVREEDDHWTLSVQDNGIGINPENAERIFKMFQRLHSRDAYAGTGMGLAICKKVVELHGGRIWVEAVPGDGACFFFTLPRSGPHRRLVDINSKP